MRKSELSWIGSDLLETYAQIWEPTSGEPKAVVCLIHGLGEHSGRYSHVAKRLTENGYVVFAHDLRGHGKSAGIRGHASTNEVFIGDIAEVFLESGKRFPGKPLFLYGHSLGANI